MNFIHPNRPELDKELFFGPLYKDNPDDAFKEWPGNTLAHVAVAMGSFPSLGQARKNGFIGELKPGYQEIKIGKRKAYILNDSPNSQEPLDES